MKSLLSITRTYNVIAAGPASTRHIMSIAIVLAGVVLAVPSCAGPPSQPQAASRGEAEVADVAEPVTPANQVDDDLCKEPSITPRMVEAQRLYEMGQAASLRGDYWEAIARMQNSYEMARLPGILARQAAVYQKANQPDMARSRCEEALERIVTLCECPEHGMANPYVAEGLATIDEATCIAILDPPSAPRPQHCPPASAP